MASDKHDQAVELTEQALDQLASGNDKAADRLVSQAKKLDPSAPAEVLRDLDEDAVHRRAYDIWERSGRPDGAHQDNWEQARREIEAET